MASDGNKPDKSDHGLKSTESKTALADQLDLDKNPIKYARHDGSLSEEAHDKTYMELTLKSGNHSELAQKLIRQRIEARAKDFPRWPAEATSGVRLMWLESRFYYDRERLGPDFDDEWREYRAKYLTSLELHPEEPLRVKAYDYSLTNPLRRGIMKFGDFIEDKIYMKFFTKDKQKAMSARWVTTRIIGIYFASVGFYYYLRYCENQWWSRGGPKIMKSRPIIYPNHPHFPFVDYKHEGQHYWDNGFSRRTIFKDLRDYEDTTAILR